MKFTKQRYGYKGSKSAYEGIRHFLAKHYNFPYTKKGGEKKVKLIMLAFLKENDTKFKEGFNNSDAHYNARRIQANFQQFAVWMKARNQEAETQ